MDRKWLLGAVFLAAALELGAATATAAAAAASSAINTQNSTRRCFSCGESSDVTNVSRCELGWNVTTVSCPRENPYCYSMLNETDGSHWLGCGNQLSSRGKNAMAILKDPLTQTHTVHFHCNTDLCNLPLKIGIINDFIDKINKNDTEPINKGVKNLILNSKETETDDGFLMKIMVSKDILNIVEPKLFRPDKRAISNDGNSSLTESAHTSNFSTSPPSKSTTAEIIIEAKQSKDLISFVKAAHVVSSRPPPTITTSQHVSTTPKMISTTIKTSPINMAKVISTKASTEPPEDIHGSPPLAEYLKQGSLQSDDEEDEPEGSGSFDDSKNNRRLTESTNPSSHLPARENRAVTLSSTSIAIIITLFWFT